MLSWRRNRRSEMAKMEYTELSSANIQDKRDLVISEYSRGGFTLAQRLIVEEGNKKTGMYMKNSIHVDNVDNLINLRDALNIAIEKVEKNQK